MKSGFYTTTIDDQLSDWTKRKLQSISQSQACTKKGHGHYLVVQIHYSFLNPRETITSEKYAQQINEMHQKLQCLQPALVNGWAQFSMATPYHTSHNQRFTSWTNRATEFCLICHIHLTSCLLTTTSSIISTTFCRENASTTSRMQKLLSKSSLNPETWIFMPQG